MPNTTNPRKPRRVSDRQFLAALRQRFLPSGKGLIRREVYVPALGGNVVAMLSREENDRLKAIGALTARACSDLIVNGLPHTNKKLKRQVGHDAKTGVGARMLAEKAFGNVVADERRRRDRAHGRPHADRP